MMKRMNLALGAIAALVLVTGCGADPVTDDTAIEPSNEAASSEHEHVAAESPDESESATQTQGRVTVDGVAYDLDSVHACDPLNDGLVERELELQGTGTHDGDRFQVDVYVQTVGGQPMNDVAWSGPEGIFGDPRELHLTVDDAASHVSGTATLHDAMTQEETISIEFDVQIPSDTVACR